MYARELDGTTLTFGVSGKLIMNGLVMYDRETGSLWSQVLGQGVEGRFKDRMLTVVPAPQTTWERWLAGHPNTVVLDKGGRYVSDSYSRYYSGGSKGILGETSRDTRLDSKDLILGVTIGGNHKAYPFDALAVRPVLNDVVGGVPVLVTFDARSSTGSIFDPVVGLRTPTFVGTQGAPEALMEDIETKTVWDPASGEAVSGPLEGEVLARLPSHYEFWFSWKDYRPGTELYVGAASE